MINPSSDETRTILVIEDSALTRRCLRSVLESEASVLEASDGDEGLILARSRRPDLILLDVGLPGPDGFETLRRLKADSQTSAIPVIFLSALTEPRSRARGLDLGAVDFVAKPFDPIDLRARVGVALRTKTMQDKLERRAHVDALTGLGNRHALNDRLQAECRSCRARGVPLAALIVDLDNFKSVNDRLGHPTGDDLLRAAARALRESIRDGDFVARHGGDEFVVIAPDCDRDGAWAMGDRFRLVIASGTIREHVAPESLRGHRERRRMRLDSPMRWTPTPCCEERTSPSTTPRRPVEMRCASLLKASPRRARSVFS